jgi:hypothetical protein
MSASEFAKLKERLAAFKFKKESKDGGGRVDKDFGRKQEKSGILKLKIVLMR